jgi:hypothetical protein
MPLMSTEKFEVQFSQGSMAYQTSRGSDQRVGPVESSGFEIFRTLKMPVAGAGFTTSSTLTPQTDKSVHSASNAAKQSNPASIPQFPQSSA